MQPTPTPAAEGSDLREWLGALGYEQLPGYPGDLENCRPDWYSKGRTRIVAHPGGKVAIHAGTAWSATLQTPPRGVLAVLLGLAARDGQS